MKRALIVGINDYPFAPLAGCVEDAVRMAALLSRNEDDSPNFDCQLITSKTYAVNRSVLREKIDELFASPCDTALFYFSGHGSQRDLNGYLVTQDASRYDEGVSMADIIRIANNATSVKEVTLIVDCCHSGALGNTANPNNTAELREGVAILTASRDSQPSLETSSGGVFTSLVVEALKGGAADILGKVGLASIYAYVDEALGAWMQRPLMKAHVSRTQVLRTCQSPIQVSVLRQLPRYFTTADAELPLDPSYEPESESSDPDKAKVFRDLQKCRAVKLVEPVGNDHMYWAAMESRSCRLTPLGQHYWFLANSGKL